MSTVNPCALRGRSVISRTCRAQRLTLQEATQPHNLYRKLLRERHVATFNYLACVLVEASSRSFWKLQGFQDPPSCQGLASMASQFPEFCSNVSTLIDARGGVDARVIAAKRLVECSTGRSLDEDYDLCGPKIGETIPDAAPPEPMKLFGPLQSFGECGLLAKFLDADQLVAVERVVINLLKELQEHLVGCALTGSTVVDRAGSAGDIDIIAVTDLGWQQRRCQKRGQAILDVTIVPVHLVDYFLRANPDSTTINMLCAAVWFFDPLTRMQEFSRLAVERRRVPRRARGQQTKQEREQPAGFYRALSHTKEGILFDWIASLLATFSVRSAAEFLGMWVPPAQHLLVEVERYAPGVSHLLQECLDKKKRWGERTLAAKQLVDISIGVPRLQQLEEDRGRGELSANLAACFAGG